MSGQIQDQTDLTEKSAGGRITFTFYASWTCVVGSLLGSVIVAPGKSWLLMAGNLGILAVGCLGLWLLHRKRPFIAFRILSLGGWAVVMLEPAFTNGLFSILLVTLPMILIMSAWLLGTRAALWLGAATLPVVFVYTALHLQGYLGTEEALPVLPRALVLCLIVAVSTALAYFAARVLGNQLEALNETKRALESGLAKLAKRDEELSLLTERVPAMIARLDHHERFRFANSSYARFHGTSPEEIVGRHAREIVGDKSYHDIEPGIRKVLAGEPHQQLVTRTNEAGESRMLMDELVPAFGRDGRVEGWYALLRDVTEAERASRALRHIVEGTSRATGTAFFHALTKNLAQATGLRFAMVAELLPQQGARALAYWTGSGYLEGIEYALQGAPCEQVLEHGEVCFPDRVAELFPLDRPLTEQGIRGYWGLRLDAVDGTPMGLLVLMDQAPITRREQFASLMAVFAARAAAELERLRAEQESRRLAERFAKVFQNSPIPIAISRLSDGFFIDVNPAYERTFGWPRNEIVGRTSLEIGLWPTPEARARWLEALHSEAWSQEIETTFHAANREPKTVLLSADAFDLDGVPHIINFVYDLTERRRAEREQRLALERFEAIFQHTPNVAIQGFDAKGKVIHWNRASERMYGITQSEAVGEPIQRILQTPATALEFEAQLAVICQSRQPSEPAEWPILLRDRRQIWVLSTMFPVFANDELVEIFCMDVDITALKEATRKAQEINTELEARVAERTAELADLNRELEAFSYSVSHDLRAPLRSIQGFGSILEERYGQQLDELARDHLQRMVRAAQRLAQLIDDLLKLTRINRAEMHWVDVNLSALARDILDEIRHGAPQRQAELHIEEGLIARGDPQLLRVALQNLLDNAWKYSAKVPEARIEFSRHHQGSEIVYAVRDNGAGFDMAYADKLFVPFQRLHNPRDFEGTGIGLATVARVIHRHGGRVWAQSAPGQGAEFSFTLPA